MSKITIFIEDGIDGTIELDADFDNPGVSFEQCKSNPTPAEAIALMWIGMLASTSTPMVGKVIEEDGMEHSYE